ncbi:hypothetical protein [Vibrio kanaloae]|uniref:hypothetical protein n=1 Tax=Vibrio kanaloae TaxID=170673 RepID=UPI000C8151A8|nr:hypothetical protein [Vibrio kanaloae]
MTLLRCVSFLFFGFISFYVNSDNFSLPLSTHINIHELYRDAIEKVYFEPNVLALEVNEDKIRFKDAVTSFNMTTRIPREAASIGYTVSLDKNVAFCEDVSGGTPVEQYGFVSLLFDGKAMIVGDTRVFSDFNSDDGLYKSSQHPVVFSFKSFDEIITKHQASICEGEIDISVGVDI